ncbi:Protein CBG26428 [Caenorhabditis briggsae]|uniref:Protein CBG26428 n=1 Tax=Caenorhabditis briggsae TaxID=6238 RepID=B6ILG1_CAEBR|nr:Protein CBG26428 [Caenorhabditis briggsae]CAS00741.1 Protein CBG26428 [Caenorhabditis briggsae]
MQKSQNVTEGPEANGVAAVVLGTGHHTSPDTNAGKTKIRWLNVWGGVNVSLGWLRWLG